MRLIVLVIRERDAEWRLVDLIAGRAETIETFKPGESLDAVMALADDYVERRRRPTPGSGDLDRLFLEIFGCATGAA